MIGNIVEIILALRVVGKSEKLSYNFHKNMANFSIMFNKFFHKARIRGGDPWWGGGSRGIR